eukprot:m.12892 g.12892  ORF g.12892 m.12892 type:complete len:420 (-) comp4076_c0_seq1:1221-2480(-)
MVSANLFATVVGVVWLCASTLFVKGEFDENSLVPLPFNVLMHSRASSNGFLSSLAANIHQGSFSVSHFNVSVGRINAMNFEETTSKEVYDVGEASALSLFIVTHLRPSSVPQIEVNSVCPGLFQLHANEEGRLLVTTCDGDTPVVSTTNVVISDEGNGLTFIAIVGSESLGTITLSINSTFPTHKFSQSFASSKGSTLTMKGEQDVAEMFWSNFQFTHQYVNALAVYFFSLYNNGPVDPVVSEIQLIDVGDPTRPLDTSNGDADEISGGDLPLVGCVDGFTSSTFEPCLCPQDCRRCLLPLYEGTDPICTECNATFVLHLENCLLACPVGFEDMVTGTAHVCAVPTTEAPTNNDSFTTSASSAKAFMIAAIVVCVITIVLLVFVFITYKRAVSSREKYQNFNSKYTFEDDGHVYANSKL